MWRATVCSNANLNVIATFQSTPSVWRATDSEAQKRGMPAISIHALRVESDGIGGAVTAGWPPFQSTPSVWRATDKTAETFNGKMAISIHALRVESDVSPNKRGCGTTDFNPRPPCGERLR